LGREGAVTENLIGKNHPGGKVKGVNEYFLRGARMVTYLFWTIVKGLNPF